MRNNAKNRAAVPAILAVAAAASIFTAIPALARITVDVNGSPIAFSGVQPTQMNGRVFIPLRAVAENLNANVRWDAATQTVYGTRGDRSFTLPIGNRTAYVQGHAVTLDAPARLMSGTTMVPLRFVAEALGADVNWNSSMQKVAVNLDGATGGGGNASNNGNTNNGQGQMVIPADTVVRAELVDALNSRNAKEGDRVTARLDANDRSRFPEGTKFEGRVTDVQNATKSEPGVIDVEFDRAMLPDGTSVRIDGSLAGLDKDSVEQTADGRLVARKKKDAKYDLKWVGYGAAGGALLSAIFGGNILRGVLIGAGGGGLYGLLDKEKKRKGAYSDVSLAAGTEFGIRLNNRVAFADRDNYRYN